MKKLIFLILILIDGKAISAQTTVITNERGEKITEVKSQSFGKRGYSFSKSLYRGSILYNDGFEMATIKLKGGQPVDAPILFNIYADELVAKVEGKEILFTKTDFSMRGQNFITQKGHYYELLFENENVKLLKKYNCVVRPYRGHGGLNMGGTYDGEFIRNETYFLLFADDRMREFKFDKASLLSAFSKENTSLAEKLRNDTLRINKVEDVISLLK
jgi:hypothetical protein